MRFFASLILSACFALTLRAQQPSGTVSVTSFNAVPRGEQVFLSWNPEKPGIESYELEKSKNGSEFIAFGQVQGATDITEFFETDYQPFEGLSYYRLRVTGTDGSISFSNIVPVKYNENGQGVSPVAAAADGNNASAGHSVLVVVRNSSGEEFYSKVDLENRGNPVECKDTDPNLIIGTYIIVGCSDQDLYCKEMLVK